MDGHFLLNQPLFHPAQRKAGKEQKKYDKIHDTDDCGRFIGSYTEPPGQFSQVVKREGQGSRLCPGR